MDPRRGTSPGRLGSRRARDYDTAGAGRELADFVDDLSNWYVRRSRRRFWDGEQNALSTLYESLDILTRLLAPFVPFITEEVWQQVIRPADDSLAESVHLTSWPAPDPALIDPALSAQVRTARALTEAGRSARKNANLRIRQPLARAFIGVPAGAELTPELISDVADELNVKLLEPLASTGELVDITVKANFRSLGRRFGKRTQHVAGAIQAADPTDLVQRLRDTGEAAVEVDGETVSIEPDDVLVSEVPRIGWVVESQRGATIALDTTITPELAAEGIARDLVRLVQQARRDAGFDVSDHIALTVAAPAEVLDAVRRHRDLLAGETLSDTVDTVDERSGGFAGTVGAEVPVTVHVVRIP